MLKVLVVQLVLVTAAYSIAVHPPKHNNLASLNINEEWTLVPDSKGRLYLMHINEIFNPDGSFKFATAMRSFKKVKFFLYNKKNTNGSEVKTAKSLVAAGFNPAVPTRFIIHGWLNNRNSDVNSLIRKAYLAVGDFNVFVVDWSGNAETINYIAARMCVDKVAKRVAEFITDVVIKEAGASYADIHIIGHSLGAHIAGITGKKLKKKVRACIGLDPASSMFTILFPSSRISSGDADYVEIIHTSAFLGFISAIGTTDFYPNNGRDQNGCESDLVGQCSHSRAYEYFAESIRNKTAFKAVSENGVVAYMGGEPSNAGKGLTGVFYLNTNMKLPYGQG